MQKDRNKEQIITGRSIRMLALDLDETTLTARATLPERNRAALERAAACGVEIVIASGRSLNSMEEARPLFPWSHYAVCSNGATVYHLPEGKLLQEALLSEEVVLEILRVTEGEDVAYEAYVDGQAYAQREYVADPSHYRLSRDAQVYVQRTRQPVDDILKFVLEHRGELQSLVLLTGTDELKPVLEQRLAGIGREKVYLTSSVERMIETAGPDCGKHNGLRFVAELLDMPREEIAAFGNADNDADMLAWAGVGVAVANASEKCKASADLLTADYRDCGVAEAVEEFFRNGWISGAPGSMDL